MRNRNRSSLLKFGAALAVAGLITGCSSGGEGDAAADGTTDEPLVVASWGGTFDEALTKAYFEDFTAETGIEVVIAPADYARFVAMNEDESSEWNSIDASDAMILDWADSGFIDKMPAGAERADLLPENVAEYTPGSYLNSYVIVYNKDAFETPPTTWTDFFDTENFPGQRAGVSVLQDAWAEIALLADGVSADELYPLDFDRAFAKLDELKPNLLLTTGYAELRQAIETGQVDIAMMPSGSAARSVIASDGALEISWEQNIANAGGFPMSVYGPNQAAAAKLAEFMQDPERQAVFTNISYYGSAMSEAEQYIDPEILPYVTTNADNFAKAVTVDAEWLAANQDEYIDRFTEWVSR